MGRCAKENRGYYLVVEKDLTEGEIRSSYTNLNTPMPTKWMI